MGYPFLSTPLPSSLPPQSVSRNFRSRESFSKGGASPQSQNGNLLPALFWACFFFLCCADLVFAVRIHGYNFRWGQLLILGLAPYSLIHLLKNRSRFPEDWSRIKTVGLAWTPFVLIYGLAVSLSAQPFLGIMKLGWTVFNIGGAALVLLNSRWSNSLQRGFRWGLLTLASFVVFQAFSLFVFQNFLQVTGVKVLPIRFILTGHLGGLNIPLGIAQLGDPWQGHLIYRPCAFYYEPNYAACALAFSLSLLLILEKERRWFSSWAPGLVAAAVFLTSSRGGILDCAFTLGVLFLASFFKPLAEKKVMILKTILFTGFVLGLFLLSAGGRLYLDYFAGPLGLSTIKVHVVLPHTSEGDRVISLNQGIQELKEHPWLGQGYQPMAGMEGMATGTLNTWVEIGMESGLLGLASFLFALIYMMALSINSQTRPSTVVFLLTAWAVQFGINYNLAPTFPRLDYWLLFFFSILLAQTPTNSHALKAPKSAS